MHPFLFGGKISSYSVMMVIGILSAVILFRVLSDYKKTPSKIYDYYSTAAVVSIAVGLVSAFLFQAIYHWIETWVKYGIENAVFELSGLTFMGGLIGGAVTFILFAVCSKTKEIRRAFFVEAEKAAPCIAIAHFFGRIGCFLAGCCYGIRNDKFGVQFVGVPGKRLPTNLYEAIFLLVLFGVLLFFTLYKKPRGFNLITYCFAYAVFRFSIEFIRDDNRYAVFALTPSQIQSIVLFLCGAGLTVFRALKPDFYTDLDPLLLNDGLISKCVPGIPIINVYSKGDYPADALSNFYPHAFTLDGVECASMEGFLQSLKTSDPEKQKAVCKLAGLDAKKSGRFKFMWKITGSVTWQGEKIKRMSPEYQTLIARAYDELNKNEHFAAALKATENAQLVHALGETDPKRTILTEKEFIGNLNRLREENAATAE